MKFSGKMCLMKMLKVTKKQGFTLCLENTFLEKPHGRGQIDPPSPPKPFKGKLTNNTGFPIRCYFMIMPITRL